MTEIEKALNLVALTLALAHAQNVETGEITEKDFKMDRIALESEAFKAISLIGYDGPLLSENDFKKALEEGPKNVEYTKLISFLANELRVLYNFDEHVNAITAPEDSTAFIMEISSFLNELGCPYVSLKQGHVSDRLSTVRDRIFLLEHLITELISARVARDIRPEKKIELKLKESSHAADLRKTLQTLGFTKPPPNITMPTLMQKLVTTMKNTVKEANPDLIGTPIFNGTLSGKQWETLDNTQLELHDDYRIRREMVLKRLDCTLQSFQWSGKTKGKDDAVKVHSDKSKVLKEEPDVDISDLLVSRKDLAIMEKTSSALVRKNTKSSVNKVIIGQVPDRGGRTSEQAPPPPEMPPWQQRSAGPSGGGGFRGGQQGHFNRGGSNYSRGGGQQNNYKGGNSYSQGGNSYSQGGSNYSQSGSNYSQSGSNYSQGSNRGDYSNYGGDSRSGSKSFDSAGSCGGDSSRDHSRRSSDYSRDSDYSRGSGSYQSNIGYSQSSSSGGYPESSSGYSQDSGRYSQSSGNYSRGGYDSAGSYGRYTQDYQEPKRVKTFDQFQQSKSTYADQYVQESQHNQQYQSRDRDNRNRGGRGRSNYNRGGGGGYRN